MTLIRCPMRLIRCPMAPIRRPMTRLRRPLALGFLLVAVPAGPAAARQQETGGTAAPAAASPTPERSAWRPLRVAKWATLAASAALAGYGFAASLDADDRYARIADACRERLARCQDRLPSGAYADAGLEDTRREAKALDRQARWTLLAGQLGAAASVVLFILDLQESAAPPNVPYEPGRLRLGPAPGGGVELSVRVR